MTRTKFHPQAPHFKDYSDAKKETIKHLIKSSNSIKNTCSNISVDLVSNTDNLVQDDDQILTFKTFLKEATTGELRNTTNERLFQANLANHDHKSEQAECKRLRTSLDTLVSLYCIENQLITET